jgi:hypothetical protein
MVDSQDMVQNKPASIDFPLREKVFLASDRPVTPVSIRDALRHSRRFSPERKVDSESTGALQADVS